MYELCVASVQERIRERYSGLRQKSFGGKAPSISIVGEKGVAQYLLWMCARVAKMNQEDESDRQKALSWVGYVMGQAELLGLIPDNIITRDLVRRDKQRMKQS